MSETYPPKVYRCDIDTEMQDSWEDWSAIQWLTGHFLLKIKTYLSV